MRTAFYLSTICYLQQDNKILMLNFRDKWDQRYCAPGGKVQFDETPSESIVREFDEETGLHLLNPTLRGIAQWIDTDRQ